MTSMLHEFSLTVQLPDDATSLDDHVERLGQAGCTDALLGLGRSGFIRLDFTRAAPTLGSAQRSALQAVQRAIPDTPKVMD